MTENGEPLNYSGGRIVRLKLHNFLTYDDLELYPINGLNLIIGPNGSGKSSIVCAICLALGGKPVFTGRQLKLAEYIKHNKQSAYVEIELDDPSGLDNIVIQREIKDSGTSIYHLNDRVVKESMVEKAVSRFNIQVNNLCQFLPQEKVADFSRMDSVQLLESMQQAVGDVEMFRNHEDLKKLRTKARALEGSIRNDKDHLQKEKKKNERLQSEVQIFEEREKYKKDIDLLEEKRRVYEFIAVRDEAVKLKDVKLQCLNKLKEFEQAIEPLRTDAEHIKNDIQGCDRNVHDLVIKINSYKSQVSRHMKEITSLDEQIFEVQSDLTSKIDQQNKQKERVADIQQQIAAFKNKNEQCKAKLEEMKVELHEVLINQQSIIAELTDVKTSQDMSKDKLVSLNVEQNALQIKRQKLNDVQHKKLAILKQRDRDTFEALMWLRDNKNMFRRTIYEPIMTTICIHNLQNAKYVESHIPFRDMTAFVCEDKTDAKHLVKILREEKKLAINVAMTSSKPLAAFQPQMSSADLKRRFHFSGYLGDLFSAPDAVPAYLCDTHKIHNIPVGDENTEKYLQPILEEIPFSRFYFSNCVCVKRFSKYGNKNVSISNAPLKRSNLLCDLSPSAEEQLALEEELKAISTAINEETQSLRKLEKREQDLSELLEKCRGFRKDYKIQEDTVRNTEAQIRQKTEFLNQVNNKKINVEDEKQKAKLRIDNCNSKKINIFGELEHLYEGHINCMKQKIILRFHHICFTQKRAKINGEILKAEDKAKSFRHEHNEAHVKYVEQKQKAKYMQKIAEDSCGLALGPQTEKTLRNRYRSLPSNLEEIKKEIYRLTAKVNCISEADDEVIKEHAKRKKTIMEKEKELQNAAEELGHINYEIERKKTLWLTPLEELIGNISKTFSRYFESLDCVGEVALNKSENPNDFDRYGLSIRVKYHDSAPLRELSQAHHSGGECSVATIIFILSLQELTEVPFRCVDEINQGMDSLNERRIFDLVSMSAEKSSQYFLLTPKLLLDLKYSSKMKIHIIHNGPSFNYKKWDFKEITASYNQQKIT